MVSTTFQRGFLPVLFLAAGALAIFLARTSLQTIEPRTQNLLRGWQYVILAVLVGGLVLASVKRWSSRVWWESLLTIAVFLGVWYASLSSGLPLGIALAVSSVLTLVHLFVRIVGLHDLFYLVGAVGVALLLAFWIPAEILVIGLVGFTVYDMVAGPPEGAIHRLASTLSRYGIVPGFILPMKAKDLVSGVDEISSRAALLGASDVILPVSLIARAALHGTTSGTIVLIGSILGLLVFTGRRDLPSRAALVPLAIGTIVSFFAVTLDLL